MAGNSANIGSPRTPAVLGLSDTKAFVAVTSVLIGTFTGVVNSRLTDIGLADLRGSLGISFDEASWITTAYVVAEATAVPATIWMRQLLSPVRCIMFGAGLFSLLSLIAPFSPSLSILVIVQALRGFSAGILIPMTYGVIMRYVPQQWRLIWLALYAMVSGVTPSFSVYLEAVIVNYLSWRYLFWLNVLPAAITVFAAAYGLKPEPVRYMRLRRPDFFGLLTLSLGIAALVAACDQGNRLDWFNSGLIVGLLGAASLLLAAFVMSSISRVSPMVGPQLLRHHNFGLGIVVMLLTRLALTSASFAIPQFLIRVQGYRALESGALFLTAALLQILLTPAIAWVSYRTDPRNLVCAGALTFGFGTFLCVNVTSNWTAEQFLLPLALQTIGGSCLAVPVMIILTEDIEFAQIPWAASWVHITRTVGTAVALAFVGTLVRVREQLHSNLVGQHIQAGDLRLETRLDQLSSLLQVRAATDDGLVRSSLVLARTVQREAYVMAFADAFFVIGACTLVAAVVSIILRRTNIPGRFL
ncbi:DHA2 family multidrug resistance protein [Rhizobium sp. BK529]|uniref:DHA2 family efflux MFS transporter permease subunit n=1 Tax=Rhizobium sp. BK529 TaxID=2586983 RepID=UPI0016120AF8|nr:DHA2 family efflux MFS transporter permease subunit [Rhizobium sp. BK529]MBB3595162.1 DHA2 family multidrug resistance protein [Rhizobium sp. BK529]